MKTLVVGGSGFIGSHLVDLLIEQNHDVTVFDINKPHRLEPGFINGDVTNGEYFYDSVENIKPDVIFACSGILGTAETFEHIQKTIDVNLKGKINILDAARSFGASVVDISLTNNWLNPYTITKQADTKFCLMYAQEYGVKVSVLKALNAYGERQAWDKVRKIGPSFIINAIQNKPLIINGSGNQIVDMVYAGDVAKMMLLIVQREAWGVEMDGGTGYPMTVNEVAEKIIKLSGSKSKLIHKPMRKGEPVESITLGNPGPVKQLLGFYPEADFDESMTQTIEWYQRYYYNNI